ncbi:hypothetical protein ABI59_03770 [Acidobacteria bacterium Mor1]|nr:hypothetical protein ABI59_03770 [Acidobacteria bacterium Mor1]
MNSMPFRYLLIPTLLLSFLSFAACTGASDGGNGAGTASSQRKVDGIVLVTLADLGTAQSATFGGSHPTPSLDRLAASSVVFDDASTPVPMTRPALTSLMTGMAPDRHGVWNDVRDTLSGQQTLAGALNEAGWSTVAISGTALVESGCGLDQGFELYEAPANLDVGPLRYFPIRSRVSDGEVVDKFNLWFESKPADQPFFAWVHLSDPHGVVTSGRNYDESSQAYAQSVEASDKALTALLDTLEPMSGRLAVVVAGTNGVLHEDLAPPAKAKDRVRDPGRRGASYWLVPETLQVPLILRAPEQPAGRSGARVWLPDVTATLASLAGVSLGDQVEGVDLLAGSPEPDRVRRAWTWATDDEFAWPALTAVDAGDGWQSFATDQLASGDGSAASALAAERAPQRRERTLSAEIQQALTQAGLAANFEPRMSPALEEGERNGVLSEVQRIRHHYQAGRVIRQARRSRLLIEDHPQNLAAMFNWIYFWVYEATGDGTARGHSVEAIKRYPLRPDLMHWSGTAHILGGDHAKAEILLNAAIELGGEDRNALYDLACAAARQDEVQRSLGYLERALAAGWANLSHLERDPDLANVRTDPGFAALMAAQVQ